MNQRPKICVGILTCNRPELFSKLLHTLNLANISSLIVVNDGKPFEIYPDLEESLKKSNWFLGFPSAQVIQHEKSFPISYSKNEIVREFLNTDCDYLFILEDDIEIITPQVFEKYIEVSKFFGLEHMCYALHGPNNKNALSKPIPRLTLQTKDSEISLSLYRHCVGAFCMYSRKCIEETGLFDQIRFDKNAWEHVDHTYRCYKSGFCTPFWWIPDIANSELYIRDQDPDLSKSIIRNNQNKENDLLALKAFFDKYGMYPGNIPDSLENDVIAFLRTNKGKHE